MNEMSPQQRRHLEALGLRLSLSEMSAAILRATVTVGERLAPDNAVRVEGYDDEVVYDAARAYLAGMAAQVGTMDSLNRHFVEQVGFGEAREICFGELRMANAPYIRAVYGSCEIAVAGNFTDEYTPHRGASSDYGLRLVDRAMTDAIHDK